MKMCDYFSDSIDINALKEKRKESIYNLFLDKAKLTNLWVNGRKDYLYSDMYYYDDRDISEEEAFLNSNSDMIAYYFFNNNYSKVILDIYHLIFFDIILNFYQI